MDVLGIDLAKLSFDATLLLQTGSSHYAAFPNTPEGFLQLATWLREHNVSSLHACMEATNIYWQALASWLHAQGYSVSVVNPARIKGYAMATMQRNKTDKLDSAIIASFCCILPIVFALTGFSILGASALFDAWRPYLLGLTFGLLGFGFYFAYRPTNEQCAPGSACAKREAPCGGHVWDLRSGTSVRYHKRGCDCWNRAAAV